MSCEGRTQAKIIQYIEKCGGWVLNVHGHAMQRKSIDLVCCWRGQFVAIEVKHPGEDADPYQAWELRQIKAAGGRAIVVTSVEEVKGVLGG